MAHAESGGSTSLGRAWVLGLSVLVAVCQLSNPASRDDFIDFPPRMMA